jgi:hypothetical protein
VFSFGNNIYGLLTGLWVFYDIEDDDMKQVSSVPDNDTLFALECLDRKFLTPKII